MKQINIIRIPFPALVPLHKALAGTVPAGFLLVCGAAALGLLLGAMQTLQARGLDLEGLLRGNGSRSIRQPHGSGS